MTKFEGFTPPSGPPQLEAEETAGIRDAVLNSPDWDPSFAFELATLCRRHLVVRSALNHAHVLTGMLKDLMVNERDPVEMYRRQGAVKGLTQFFETLVQNMEATQRDEEFNQ